MRLQKALLALAVGVLLCSCANTAPKQTIGIKKENRNESVRPGDDFFEYANGGWMKANPLTDEYSRYGAFEQLGELNTAQLRGLVDELAATEHEHGTVAQQVADMYKLATDSARLNKEGAAPLLADFAQVDAIADKTEYFRTLAEMSTYASSGFFRYGIDADMKSSKENLFELGQGGISLGEKEYYVENDANTQNIRNKFQEMVVRLFQLTGDDEAQAQTRMQDVMRIETRLAQASLSNVEQRDPANLYHKMTVEELKQGFGGLDWDVFFGAIGVEAKELNVAVPAHLKEVESIIRSESLDALKNYMKWNLLDDASTALSDDFQNGHFEFYGKVMSGAQQQQPLWKRGINTVNRTIGMALGRMYVEKYFPAAAKERMVQLVKNLQVALGQRIDAQAWMSEETKQKAHEKLDAFYVKVGYPDEWKDYSTLDIDPAQSFYENLKAVRLWNWRQDVAKKMNRPVDPNEWFMSPQTVNAYYNPTTNEICFPAGILQYPFFDRNADDAFNYGAIGVVIGHEMTHGFDDEGSQFDKDGNLSVWWTAEDRARFEERTHQLAAFFDQIEVLPGLKANGQLTCGENIADHGGLEVAFQAFRNATQAQPLETVEGLTPEQRFFLAYASVWGQHVREAEMRRRTKSDPHSLGRWRVNGTLPHINAWYEAFGVKEGDKMFLPEDRRVQVW
ncbi:MAG: M13 family metallopeptidase [Bacteroidales bacterium]|nr:M13 family metallopeptidase [Bacteroidales bacterium]